MGDEQHALEGQSFSKDSVEVRSYELHSNAWSDWEDQTRHLTEALKLLEAAIDSGHRGETVVNNYAAVLLDLGANMEARQFLQENLVDTKSCHANMAIAVAKTTRADIDMIRKFNDSS